MIFSLFRGRRAEANQRVVEGLHDEIVAAVRSSAFYIEHGVPDTFQGRFELLILVAGLALRRLKDAEEPGPAVAQDLVDMIFRRLDSGLREVGVGDLAVPKRMKTLAEAFLGRAVAYDGALRRGEDALAEAISRNILDDRGDGRGLARYAADARRRLSERTLDDCLRCGFGFIDPAMFASGARP